MAQPKPPSTTTPGPSKKRKDPPTTSKASANKKHKPDFRARQRDARVLSTQTTGAAFANGALDVEKFTHAREFEIRALEQGLQRSRTALNRRAFQQVPRELRRRTASHNVKRVPKRLRERGKKEMLEDNTPTVSARRRKLTRHMRLRLETVKKLRALGSQRKAAARKKADGEEKVTATDPTMAKAQTAGNDTTTEPGRIKTRTPKIKKSPTLAKPTIPKAKFRKRQIHKSWLPTHLFHAKRAHMTPPSAPLWRFAIPLTPTEKSYRPTHRAAHERGAVAWDVSYVSTIGLEGQQRGLEGLLRGLGVAGGVWGTKGAKWRLGTRALETDVFEREEPHSLIAPVAIIWCVAGSKDVNDVEEEAKRKRRMFLRVHPSAFFQVWEEVIRLAKVAKPAVSVEDLRFEIGSIEITGPGSTEALLGALWPYETSTQQGVDAVGKTWTSLAGVTNPSMLPSGALLGFNIQDPRFHHPPRTIPLPETQQDLDKLTTLLATWPVDEAQPPPTLFERTARLRGSKLPSQKSINRRKALAKPGNYPDPLPADPKIPILVYTTPDSSSANQHQQSTWTLLAPWKSIQPLWYSIQYYPLSTGQQPRFGGLREQQQLAFEAGRAWFPADFPGTKAGWEWEMQERKKRLEEWARRPKGKRVAWEKVDLGDGRKGEVGRGWACDWEVLVPSKIREGQMEKDGDSKQDAAAETSPPPTLSQLSTTQALALLKPISVPPGGLDTFGKLVTVRLHFLTRGVPQTCARIYRLPSADPDLRSAWLALHPSDKRPKSNNKTEKKHNAPPHIVQRQLAKSLLQPPRAGQEQCLASPGEEDLVGFVTTGSFNLAEGRGTGIGSLLASKVLLEGSGGKGSRLCVVRNAGEGVGRLAWWELAV